MNPSDLQLVFRDDKGDQVEQGKLSAEKLQQRTAKTNTHYKLGAFKKFATIRDNRVEKPMWFRREERAARQFVYRELGLTAARGTQVTILDSEASEEAQALFWRDVPGKVYTHGFQDPYCGIVIRHGMLEKTQEQSVSHAMSKLLVHELVHAAEPHGSLYRIYDAKKNEWGVDFRQGFMTQAPDNLEHGAFYSEAVAEFSAGLYVRRLDDPTCPLVATGGAITASLPEYYTRANVDTGVPYTEGPDAYTLELIARTLQERSIMKADDFINSVLGAYSLLAATRLEGYRTFAYGVNQVQPGLYAKLRDIPRGAGAWQQGLDMTLDALEIPRD